MHAVKAPARPVMLIPSLIGSIIVTQIEAYEWQIGGGNDFVLL